MQESFPVKNGPGRLKYLAPHAQSKRLLWNEFLPRTKREQFQQSDLDRASDRTFLSEYAKNSAKQDLTGADCVCIKAPTLHLLVIELFSRPLIPQGRDYGTGGDESGGRPCQHKTTFPHIWPAKMSNMISKAEMDYITTGAEKNIRADGRKRTEYRKFQVETGVVAQASGSCRLMLDGTDILVGIKVEVGSIVPEKLDEEDEEGGDEEGEGGDGGESGFRGAGRETNDALGGLTENRGRVVCSIEW